jgi:hypothetical protein
MKRLMGFVGFKSTKNTKVPGNDKLYGVRKDKKTEYRQYMNRVGGFNRPLSPTRLWALSKAWTERRIAISAMAFLGGVEDNIWSAEKETQGKTVVTGLHYLDGLGAVQGRSKVLNTRQSLSIIKSKQLKQMWITGSSIASRVRPSQCLLHLSGHFLRTCHREEKETTTPEDTRKENSTS